MAQVLKTGDRVQLVPKYEDVSHAEQGPLSLGDVGKIIRVDTSNKTFQVSFSGHTRWYDEVALFKASMPDSLQQPPSMGRGPPLPDRVALLSKSARLALPPLPPTHEKANELAVTDFSSAQSSEGPQCFRKAADFSHGIVAAGQEQLDSIGAPVPPALPPPLYPPPEFEVNEEPVSLIAPAADINGKSSYDTIMSAIQKLLHHMENNRDKMEQRLQARLKMLDSRLENLSRQVDAFQLFPEEALAAPNGTNCIQVQAEEKDANQISTEAESKFEESKTKTASFGDTIAQNLDTTCDSKKVAETECRSKKRSSKDRSSSATVARQGTTSSRASKKKKRTPEDIWERLVDHPQFDVVCAFVVFVNSLLVGLQINHEAVSDHDEIVYEVIEYICIAFFSIELFLRLAARKLHFCNHDEWRWATFDVILVMLSWADLTMGLIFTTNGGVPGPGASVGKMLKMARMVRIMRILRMVRWLTKIRIMATLIIGSMLSLFWLLVLLLGVMYIFAIVLTQGATMWLKPGTGYEPPVGNRHYSNVIYHFGSLWKTMYTLFAAMTGGVNWAEPADASQAYGWVYFCVFTSYIFFAIFSVMNIVTGVFVDGAIQQAEGDRSLILEAQAKQKEEICTTLLEIVSELDADNSGCLSREEWEGAFVDPSIQGALSAMQVDIDECEDLFDMLDVDGDGRVDVKEFIHGMIRLKGWAKAVDIERVYCRVLQLHGVYKRMTDKMEQLSNGIEDLTHRSSQRNSKSCAAVLRRSV